MNYNNLTHNMNAVVVPMFMSQTMEQPMAKKNAQTQEQDTELSLFDVKELYDLAYNEKDKGINGEARFKKILAEAVKLDLLYRRQLAKKATYKKKPSKIQSFNTANEDSRVA